MILFRQRKCSVAPSLVALNGFDNLNQNLLFIRLWTLFILNTSSLSALNFGTYFITMKRMTPILIMVNKEVARLLHTLSTRTCVRFGGTSTRIIAWNVLKRRRLLDSKKCMVGTRTLHDWRVLARARKKKSGDMSCADSILSDVTFNPAPAAAPWAAGPGMTASSAPMTTTTSVWTRWGMRLQIHI